MILQKLGKIPKKHRTEMIAICFIIVLNIRKCSNNLYGMLTRRNLFFFLGQLFVVCGCKDLYRFYKRLTIF